MRDKVFWTDAEKRAVARAAIETQHKRPDLAGLPLLREAMKALAANRRRRLVSLSQVPWFEEAVEAEARLQASESPVEPRPTTVVYPNGNPYVPFFQEIADATKRTEAAVRKLIELQEQMIGELAALKGLLQESIRGSRPTSRPTRQRNTNAQSPP